MKFNFILTNEQQEALDTYVNVTCQKNIILDHIHNSNDLELCLFSYNNLQSIKEMDLVDLNYSLSRTILSCYALYRLIGTDTIDKSLLDCIDDISNELPF